jgi:hypothetical protein
MKNPTSPVFIGTKKVQVGKQAGVEIPGFMLIRDKAYKSMGLAKNGFPATVAGTSYVVDNGEVVATSTRKLGGKSVEVKRTVAVQQCTKPVRVYLKSTKTVTVTRQSKKVQVTKRNSVQVGFPAWAGVKEIRKFLSTAGNVYSFSISGGTHLVNFAGGK